MMPEGANLAGELCMQCALCCNGSIHDSVALQDGEADFIPGARLFTGAAGAVAKMALPCAQLCENACSIYSDRPKVCRDYSCLVLKRFQEGTLTFAHAKSLIGQAVEAVEAARALLEDGEDLPAQRKRWRNSARKGTRDARFHLAMLRLNLLIDREFRREGKRLLKSVAA